MRLCLLRCSLLLTALSVLPAAAQTNIGGDATHPVTTVKDSSMLKPPPGHKVAIIEWTDMECPACAHAFPIAHAAADAAKIPLVHYDYLISGHIWSPAAEVFARYFLETVSVDLGTEYRREVFAAQRRINSPDDLQALTRQFAASHRLTLPFVVDPTGELRRKVDADKNLGKQMGLGHTPTIFVVTAHEWIEVSNVDLIDQAIRQAEQDAAKDGVKASMTRKTSSAHR